MVETMFKKVINNKEKKKRYVKTFCVFMKGNIARPEIIIDKN
jgi:hypothetical protein